MKPVIALIPLFAYSVTDGVTLEQGEGAYVLWGIELVAGQRAGAQQALERITGGRPLMCQSHGDTVQCFLPDGADVACEMVRTGHARDLSAITGGLYADCARR